MANIAQIGNGLKGHKGNAQRRNNITQGKDRFALAQIQQAVNGADEERGIFEITQKGKNGERADCVHIWFLQPFHQQSQQVGCQTQRKQQRKKRTGTQIVEDQTGYQQTCRPVSFRGNIVHNRCNKQKYQEFCC